MTLFRDKPGLRTWSGVHVDERFPALSGRHNNELFYNCEFNKIANLSLTNCCLDKSKFLATELRDVLGFSVTLNCHSFSDVELSETIFDAILVLLLKTKGNTEKRRKLIDVIGRDRLAVLLKEMSTLE